jgi:hypothetical protein
MLVQMPRIKQHFAEFLKAQSDRKYIALTTESAKAYFTNAKTAAQQRPAGGWNQMKGPGSILSAPRFTRCTVTSGTTLAAGIP